MRIPFTEEQRRYLDASARLRGVALATLLRKLIHVIADDQMVIGILDDEPVLKKGEHGGTAPPTDLFGDVSDPIVARANAVAVARARAPSVPTRRKPSRETFHHGKPRIVTRSELQAELAQAVRNTAALPVE
jgi:hypothetical protein